jgi:hypothetical protein
LDPARASERAIVRAYGEPRAAGELEREPDVIPYTRLFEQVVLDQLERLQVEFEAADDIERVGRQDAAGRQRTILRCLFSSAAIATGNASCERPSA